MTDRVAILAHEKFPDRAKTALGVLRYGDYEVVGILDRECGANRVSEVVDGVQDAPIYPDAETLLSTVEDLDELIIGVAPIGGGFEESWRPDVRATLRAGCDVTAGLHYFLADDEEFAAVAAERGCELTDVRRPPADVTVAQGVADQVDAEVVLTVGTDCSVGKMTTTMELARAAEKRGEDVAVIPTGQTGVLVEGWGIAVDRVVGDFTAGAVERMILEEGDDHDYLIVEGQGSIVHPAYSAVTCGILHGAMADELVLCHAAGREVVHGYDSFGLPAPGTYVDLYENLAAPVHGTDVVGAAVNTVDVEDEGEARATVDAFGEAAGVPATDPIRFGTEELLEAVL
jgi:uncharacterized NAD-dependent epimerase/dehydratase family protein